MRMRALSLAALLIASWPIGLFAADQDGRYTIYGRGNDSCGEFARNFEMNAAGKPSGLFSDLGFVDGYLTAINELTDATYSITGRSDASGRDR
jgi:hypothetical protein